MKIRKTFFTTEIEISLEEWKHLEMGEYEDSFGEKSLIQEIINFICDL
jgi:hypothetical protein